MDVELVFHILNGGIGDEELSGFRIRLEESYPSSALSVTDCRVYAESRSTYARGWPPTLLLGVSHVIYRDCVFFREPTALKCGRKGRI